ARQLQVADELRLALEEAVVLRPREWASDPRTCGSRGRAHAATRGSKGRVCKDSAPSSVTTVSAPSCRPIRSSGVIGFGWITTVISRSIVRPGGGSVPFRQYCTQDRSTSGGP